MSEWSDTNSAKRKNLPDSSTTQRREQGTTPTTVVITIRPGRRSGRSSATLADGTVLVQASRQPFLEAARVLLNLSYPPELWLEGWHLGASEFALRARLGIAARLSVDETRTRPMEPFTASPHAEAVALAGVRI